MSWLQAICIQEKQAHADAGEDPIESTSSVTYPCMLFHIMPLRWGQGMGWQRELGVSSGVLMHKASPLLAGV